MAYWFLLKIGKGKSEYQQIEITGMEGYDEKMRIF
jgi:hypothetical protein